MDIDNKFMVAARGTGAVLIMNPPRGDITVDDALVLAAWLVAIADPLEDKFPKVLEAVQGT